MPGVLRALVVRRERWTFTWTGRLPTLTILGVLTVILARGLCGFLEITSPVGGQFLVVEGWMPTYAYREAATQFRKGGYDKIIGVRVTQEDAGIERKLPERVAAERLILLGVPSNSVATAVYRDRTFHSAMAVKQWLQGQGLRTNFH
jgi:hypothetical protein